MKKTERIVVRRRWIFVQFWEDEGVFIPFHLCLYTQLLSLYSALEHNPAQYFVFTVSLIDCFDQD